MKVFTPNISIVENQDNIDKVCGWKITHTSLVRYYNTSNFVSLTLDLSKHYGNQSEG